MPRPSRPARRRPLPRATTQKEEPTQEARAADAAKIAAEERRTLIRRLRILASLFVLFILVVLAQIVLAQFVNLADRPERVIAKTVDTSRGRIVDRNGTLLATDSFVWEMYVDPSRYNPEKFPPEDAAAAAQQLGIDVEILNAALVRAGTVAQLAKNISREQCEAADNGSEVPNWIWCDGKRKRTYPQGGLAAHVIGFTDRDQKGLAGVEAFYEPWLRTDGAWGSDQLAGQGEPIPHEWELFLPSAGGRDVVLHLSAPLQYVAERKLLDALGRYDASSGSIIVMDVRSGGVLALANWPAFDPNAYWDAEPHTWQNPAVGLLYEPGSVFKLVTYATALDTGIFSPDAQFNDTGEVIISGQAIRNSQLRKRGWVTGWQAFAESLNTISADISLQIGRESFYQYIRLFGFGRPTEIDLGPEAAGIVKRPDTGLWSQYDQAANSFGQGISVSPLQMINAAAAVANDGVLLQPQAAKALVYNGIMHALPVRVHQQVIRPETAHTLAQMMVYTVDNYTSGKNLVPGYRVAGKTGTAEIPEQAGYTNPLTITSFVGFLPAADPQIVILVKINEPRKSRWAEQVALPVFGEVAREAAQILRLAPNTDMP